MIARIFTAPASGVEMTSFRSRQAIAGKGLEGDRYTLGTGFYTGVAEWDAHITLMQIEPVERVAQECGCALDPKIFRRNLFTRGVDLHSLVGKEFRVGSQVILRCRKLWPPCSHIVKHSGRTEIFQYFGRDCGIGADVVVGGVVSLGDVIRISCGTSGGLRL
jgi:MOSC domain-containing protein YiiM